MTPLLEAADLVMQATDHPIGRAGYRFVASTGATLGSMEERQNAPRRLGRMVSRHPGFGPAQLRLVDAAGNAVLDVEKSKVGTFSRLRVRVSLADGTALGSADGRVGFRPTVSFALRDPGGAVIAELRGGSGGQYELVDPGGTAVGVLARQLPSQGALPSGVWRSYKISFVPSAGVAVRGLALAALASLDMRLV